MFFDILVTIYCPVDKLAKSPHFECGVWRFDSSRGSNKMEGIRLDEGLLLKSSNTERYSGFESLVFR